MKRESFDKYYNTVLEPFMQSAINDSNKTGSNYEISMRDSKDAIYEEYQNQKTALRRLLGKADTAVNEDDYLHRHKVCACITISIIKCRPLFVINNFPDDDVFTLAKAPKVNEWLALSAGISLLRAYVLEDDNEAEADRKKYFSSPIFYVPEAFKHDNPDEETFDTLMILSLFDANIINGLSVSLLADIYFVLDRYHEMQCKLNEKNDQLSRLKNND